MKVSSKTTTHLSAPSYWKEQHDCTCTAQLRNWGMGQWNDFLNVTKEKPLGKPRIEPGSQELCAGSGNIIFFIVHAGPGSQSHAVLSVFLFLPSQMKVNTVF